MTMDFEQNIRQQLQDFTMPVGEEVWEAVSGKLAAKRRRALIVRWSSVAGVAAACLVAGIFLLHSPQGSVSSDGRTPSETAAVLDVANPLEDADPASIDRQLRRSIIVKSRALAEAVPSDEGQAAGEPSAQPSAKSADAVAEKTSDNTTHQYHNIPTDFPFPEDELFEESPVSRRKGITLAVNSNMGATGRNGMFVPSPMMLPGENGVAQGAVVNPVSEPSYALPISVGIQAQLPFGRHFAIGAGVDYTLLSNSFDALINKTMDDGSFYKVTSRLQYVGIPVELYFRANEKGRFTFYAEAGGTVEKGLSQKLTYNGITTSSPVSGLQYSVNAGIGVECRVSDGFGIYFDPGVVYYFDCNQPTSIRTAQPLQLRLEVGARFHL